MEIPRIGVVPQAAARYARSGDARLVELNRGVAQRIAAINAHPSPKFKHFGDLRIGGMDRFSTLRLQALRALAEQVHPGVRDSIRYADGAAWAASLEDEFPGDTASQEAALRYALRGLFLDAAVRKVRVDAEIRRNAETGAARHNARFHDQGGRDQAPGPRGIGRTPIQGRRRRS